MALHPPNAAGQQYAQIWETIAAHVRDQILSGELAAGVRLVEKDVADRFGVSRGPVREALADGRTLADQALHDRVTDQEKQINSLRAAVFGNGHG